MRASCCCARAVKPSDTAPQQAALYLRNVEMQLIVASFSFSEKVPTPLLSSLGLPPEITRPSDGPSERHAGTLKALEANPRVLTALRAWAVSSA